MLVKSRLFDCVMYCH